MLRLETREGKGTRNTQDWKIDRMRGRKRVEPSAGIGRNQRDRLRDRERG